MAQGLLGGVLPTIFSKADELKRGVYGLLTNPRQSIENTASGLIGSHLENVDLWKQAHGNPNNPLEVTNQNALNMLSERYLNNVVGFAPAGIVSPVVAKAMNMPVNLPTDEIFQKAVANTPNAQITDEGLLVNVMRKQKPQQSMTESVRGGVFYLPEGASQMKYYGGAGTYGGTEKIAGETLYKNPLVVKGATGGKAPKAAYEQLVGKDEAKQMISEAQSIGSYLYTGRAGQEAQKAKEVQKFLDKYAPDLSDYANYIVDNSSRGNQLRYALQEAAVAQKVRDAGFDSVIGYSKKKGEPTISEIFDVRESHYPNAYGDFQLMPKFEGLLD